MIQATHTDMLQSLELLEAVRQITRASDQPTLIRAMAEAAHRVLGFQRVRFYVTNANEGLIYRRFAVGIDADGEEPVRPLSSTHLLGRVALSEAAPCVWRIDDLGDPAESPTGLPTCLVAMPMPPEGRGILVADNPQSTQAISPVAADCLALLASVAASSVAHAARGTLGVEFVSKVSHELRTPLTSICAFTEMLLDGDAGPLTEKQSRYVSRVDKGAFMLLRVVEDLLELTHLETASRPLRKDRVAIQPFLEDIAFNLTPQAEARHIMLRVEAEDGLPVLTTDQQRLQQAMTNLVDNAIKYSPQGRLVRLVAARNEEGLRLAVVDEGPGIRPEEQGKVFEVFYRIYDGKASLEDKGSGLGLSIVHSIARMLGASLQLESQPGKGSTFTLIFPGPGAS
jgi:signal transduction histidine kinase